MASWNPHDFPRAFEPPRTLLSSPIDLGGWEYGSPEAIEFTLGFLYTFVAAVANWLSGQPGGWVLGLGRLGVTNDLLTTATQYYY